jgi:hypothetical protein
VHSETKYRQAVLILRILVDGCGDERATLPLKIGAGIANETKKVSCRFRKPKQEIPSNNEQEMARLHYMIQQPFRHI